MTVVRFGTFKEVAKVIGEGPKKGTQKMMRRQLSPAQERHYLRNQPFNTSDLY